MFRYKGPVLPESHPNREGNVMPYPSGSTPQVPSLSQEVVALFLNSSVETRYALTAITLLVVYTAYLIVSMSVSLSLRLVMGIIGLFRRGRGVVAEEVDGEEDNETEMVDEGDEAEDDDESEGESGEDTAVESEESGKSSDSDRSLLFSEPENGEESEAEPMNLGDESEDEVDEEESDEDDSEGDEEEDSQELGNESNDSDEE